MRERMSKDLDVRSGLWNDIPPQSNAIEAKGPITEESLTVLMVDLERLKQLERVCEEKNATFIEHGVEFIVFEGHIKARLIPFTEDNGDE